MALEKLYKFYRDESETSLDSVGLLEESKDEHLPRTHRTHTKLFFFHVVAVTFYVFAAIGLFFWASQIKTQCPCNGLIYCKFPHLTLQNSIDKIKHLQEKPLNTKRSP